MSQLRKVVGRDAIETVAGGYPLRLERTALDAWRFIDLLETGDDAHRAVQPDVAHDRLVECLALWRGQAYAR